MSSSAHRRSRACEPARQTLATAALVLASAADLVVRYGATRLSKALTQLPRPP